MSISETAVRNLKPREKPFKMSDGDGLYVLVTPNGSRLWRFDYSFAQRRKTLALGEYPAVGLYDARQKRDESRKLLATGIDPSVKRKLDKLEAARSASTTFASVVVDYLDRLDHKGSSVRTMSKNRWLLNKLGVWPRGSRDANVIRSGEEALWQAFFTAAPAQRREFEPSSKRRSRLRRGSRDRRVFRSGRASLRAMESLLHRFLTVSS